MTWTLRGITLVGLGLSFATLQSLRGFALAILLLLIEQFLEHSVFLFSAIHVTPMPTFEYDPAKWQSVAYVRLERGGRVHGHALGLVFSDDSYAIQFFDLLRTWNLGEDEDLDNNICLSFVKDSDQFYLWLYPNHNRTPVVQSMKKLSERAYHRRENAEPFLITISMIFCKPFLDRGGIASFLKEVGSEDRFLMIAMRPSFSEAPETIREIRPITKWHYKVRSKTELSKRDFEFAYWQRRRFI